MEFLDVVLLLKSDEKETQFFCVLKYLSPE